MSVSDSLAKGLPCPALKLYNGKSRASFCEAPCSGATEMQGLEKSPVLKTIWPGGWSTRLEDTKSGCLLFESEDSED